MKCPKCKKEIEGTANFCPKCGCALKKGGRRWVIPAVIGVIVLLVAAVLFFAQGHEITEEDFNTYVAYDDQFLEKESAYLNDKGYVNAEDIPKLLDEVTQVAEAGKGEGVIESYTRGDESVTVAFESGITYLFVPLEEDKLSAGAGGRILTVEPAQSSFGVKKESLMTFIDKYHNKLDYTGSYAAIGNADLIKKTYGDLYDYNSVALEDYAAAHAYALRDTEVTVESMKSWSDNKVVIFEGHGAYSPELHSCLVTGENFIGFEDFSKYKEDIQEKNIVLTSFPQIPGTDIPYAPVRQYCITSKFVDKYFGQMDDTLIFLGACLSAKDDVFAQALLDKGAAVVMGYNETTSMEYEMITRSLFFYKLTQTDPQGEAFAVTQALDYAKQSAGNTDPWGGYDAELVCFAREDMAKQYTLKGMKNTGQEVNMTFAEDYYKELVNTLGLADEHLETKVQTTTAQGAQSACLTPASGKLGIIFKDTADFDKNGIGDLVVVSLEDSGGKLAMKQTAYLFDAEGQVTPALVSNDSPFHENGSYAFYMAGNQLVSVHAEDDSSDWIDGLYYEVIDGKVQMHDDEIRVMNYDMDGPNDGERKGEILYIHKDYRAPGDVLYTVNDTEAYYALYNSGFTLSSAEDRSLGSEAEACVAVNSLLADTQGVPVNQLQPVTWDTRWNTGFFPKDAPPERYTSLKITASPSYKVNENMTECTLVIEGNYINSRGE